MVTQSSLLSLKEMEPVAREATRAALSEYPAPTKEEQANWTLGKILTETEGIFEIYIPAKRPLDAIIISRARVDRLTGAVNVEVCLSKPQSK